MRLVRWGVWGVWAASVALAGCHGGKEGTDGKDGKDAKGAQQTGGNPGKPVPVEVMKLERGEIRDLSSYLGTLISRQSVTIYPQVAGYVQRIYVKPGQRVKRGEPLLEVDPRQGRAGVQSAAAQRSSALAQRQYARSTRERAEQLLREGLLSRQDYEQSVSQAAAAEASARAAEAQLESQQVELGFYRVAAPFDGVVGDVPVKVGDAVALQTPLTSVDQSRALELSVSVPPDRAAQVKTGQTQVEVLDAQEKPVVTAPIFFVAPTPNPTTQLVELKAAFENTEGLRAGQVVHVDVVYATREALRLPTYAVTQQSSQFFAMAVAKGEGGGSVVKRTPVKLGQLVDNHYEVLEGLQEGQSIVVGSLQSVRDGQPIEPKPAQRTPGQDGVGGSGGPGDAGTAGPTDAGTGAGRDGGG